MKTKIVPFDLDTARKIQAGEIEGKIKTKDGAEIYKMSFARNGQIEDGRVPFSCLVLEVPADIDVNEPQFKPFDRVLVRDSDDEEWNAALFSHMTDLEQPYACVGNIFVYQCISYAGNEELVGTINKPKEE